MLACRACPFTVGGRYDDDGDGISEDDNNGDEYGDDDGDIGDQDDENDDEDDEADNANNNINDLIVSSRTNVLSDVGL